MTDEKYDQQQRLAYESGSDEFDSAKVVETQICPKCSLPVDSDVAFCPRDGTSIKEGMPGNLFEGRYQILEKIGAGGMSVIYKAKHQILAKTVAIKMLHPHLIKDKAMMRFQQEAKAASSLRHSNIISVHDFGTTAQGQPFMVMDFVKGTNCAELLASEGALPLPRALDIFSQLCEALDHAHSHGVLHRDLKPSNVMLVDSDTGQHVLLVDFGIAKILDPDDSSKHLTQTGELFGSPLYMSPEQCLGQNVDARSDIYSLGCVLYELLTGVPPLSGQTVMETILKHINETPQSLTETRSGIDFPEALERFMSRLLATDPKKRFQSVAEVKKNLHQLQNDVTIFGDLAEKPRQNGQNKRWMIVALISIIVLICGLGAMGLNSLLVRSMATKENEKVQISPLQTLDLRDKPFNDQDVEALLARHQSLHELDMRNTKIGDPTMATVGKLPLLTKLVLDDTHVSDIGMKQLSALNNLSFLSIDGTHITDEGLREIWRNSKLSTLSLAGNGITDRGLAYLAPLSEMQELHLRDTRVSDGAIAQYLLRFKRMTRLSLEATRVSDTATLTINKIQPISWLHLGQTNITDQGVERLATLPLLEELYLSHDKIRDRGLRALAQSHNLRRLHVDSTEVTDDGVKYLAKFNRNLTFIDLSHCPGVSPQAISELKKELPHCVIENRQ